MPPPIVIGLGNSKDASEFKDPLGLYGGGGLNPKPAESTTRAVNTQTPGTNTQELPSRVVNKNTSFDAKDWNDMVDTVIAEAAGDGPQGMVGVASVIKNRAAARGISPADVVRQPSQFEGYENPREGSREAQRNPMIRSEAEKIVQGVFDGTLQDPTGGADHFHAGYVSPDWAKTMPVTTKIGGHTYYSSTGKRQEAAAPAGGVTIGEGFEVKDGLGLYGGKDPFAAVDKETAARAAATDQSSSYVPNPSAKGLARLVRPEEEAPAGSGGKLFFSHPEQNKLAPAFESILVDSSKALGRDLTVLSGFRSPQHRVEAAKAGGPGEHSRGDASDISMKGMSDQERAALVQDLRARGAKRFITYTDSPDMLHVDLKDQKGDGSTWFMHDKTNRNMNKAPRWFQDVAAGGAPQAVAQAEGTTNAEKGGIPVSGDFQPKDDMKLYGEANPFKEMAASTAQLRPFRPDEQRPNADGSYSTEISTTWQLPSGEWVNVPSLWMGPKGPVQFDAGDEDNILRTMQAYEQANGQTFERFKSVKEAEAAAKARSAAGGAGAGVAAENQLIEETHAALDTREPGKYLTMSEVEYEAWKAEWEKENRSTGRGGDLARKVGAGNADLGRTVRAVVGMIPKVGPSIVGGLDAVDEWVTGKPVEQRLRDYATTARASVTEAGKVSYNKTWWDSEKGTLGPAWSDPDSYLGAIAESAPSTLATMGPSALLARGAYTAAIVGGLGEKAAAATAAKTALVAGAVGEGGLGGGQSAIEVRDRIAEIPRDQLLEADSVKALISQGMSPDEAIASITDDAASQAFLVAGVTTGAFGGLGDRALAKIIAEGVGGTVAKRLLVGAGRGAAGEGILEELPQSASQKVAENAAVQTVDPSQNLTEGVAEAAAGGLAAGAAMGGGLGGAGGAISPASAEISNEIDEQVASPATQQAPPAGARRAGPLARALEHGETQAVRQQQEHGIGAQVAAAAAASSGIRPAQGATVRVDADGVEPFMATVEGYEGDEAVVVDSGSGEVYQIPLGQLTEIAKPPSGSLLPTRDALPESSDDEALRPQEPVAGEITSELPPRSEQMPALEKLPSAPQPGQRVIVDTPELGRFSAKVGSYEEGATEVLVTNDAGQSYQVPAAALFVSKLNAKQVEEQELKRNPPVERETPVLTGTDRRLGDKTVSMPDALHARLYDLGKERLTSKRIMGTSQLGMDEALPAEQRLLAKEFEIDSQALGQLSDDFRYRVERAAKEARSKLAIKMPPVNDKRLKEWQSEHRRSGAIDEPVAPIDEAQVWWDAMSPDERRVVLDTAGIKRSEKLDWAGHSGGVRKKLNALVPANAISNVDTEAHAAATSPLNDLPEPTEAQQKEGNYKKGHIRLGGLDISIENPVGSERKGTGPDGKPWSVTMPAHYGYFRGTTGADGDHVDLYVKAGTSDISDENPAFVVDQIDPDTGRFDELKVILGASDRADAVDIYSRGFSDASASRRMGDITEMSVQDLKVLLKDDKATRSPQGAARISRTEQASPVQDVAQHIGPDAKPEEPVLPQLRGAGDRPRSEDEQVLDLSGNRRGQADTETSAGPDRQRGKLRAGEPSLGDKEGASPQHAEKPHDDDRGGDQDPDSMGGTGRSVPIDDSLSPRNGDVGGKRGTNATPSVKAATVEQTPVPEVKRAFNADDHPWDDVWGSEDDAISDALGRLTQTNGGDDDIAAAVKAGMQDKELLELVEKKFGTGGAGGNKYMVETRPGPAITFILDKDDGKRRIVLKGKQLADAIRKEFKESLADMKAKHEARTSKPPAKQKLPVTENTVFTEDAAEKARALLRKKLSGSTLNSGIDPEILQAGVTLAGYHIEKGARTFAAFATAMLADLGDVARPYLKSWYMGVKYDPRATAFDGMSSAADVDAAENVKPPEDAEFQAAYHGTGSDFDEFSTEMIGTGEGNQSFGWGLYFAGKKEVANHYRRMLTRNSRFLLNGVDVKTLDRSKMTNEEKAGTDALLGVLSVAEAIEQLEQFAATDTGRMKAFYEGGRDWLKSANLKHEGGGQLFEVDVPEDSELAWWDGDISDQPEGVRKILQKLAPAGARKASKADIRRFSTLAGNIIGQQHGERYIRDDLGIDEEFDLVYELTPAQRATLEGIREKFNNALSGRLNLDQTFQDYYESLVKERGSDKAASEALRAAGIPGHRFLDGASRDAGDGTYNYVIYDDSRVKIVSPKRKAAAPMGWGDVDTSTDTGLGSPADIQAVNDIVRKVAGLNDVMWMKRIDLPNGAAAWGTTTPTTAGGFYSPGQDVIAIAENTASATNAYHEAFHRLQHLFLSNAEKAVLKAEIGRLRRMVQQRIGREKQAAKMTAHEVEAEAFAAYATGVSTIKPHTALRAAWDRILKAIRQVQNFLQGRGFQTAEDVFDRAKSGAIAQRTPVSKPKVEATQFSIAEDSDRLIPTPGAIASALSGKLTDIQPAMLKTIPLNYFPELARPNMTAVGDYLRVKRLLDTYRGKKHEKAGEVVEQWRKVISTGYLGKDKSRAAQISSLMHDATLAGVDPSLTDAETIAKTGYDALRKQYLALPVKARELFSTVRDTYRQQAEELDQLLLDNVRKAQQIALDRAEADYQKNIADLDKKNLTAKTRKAKEAELATQYKEQKTRAQWTMKARMTKMRIAFENSRVPAPYFPLGRFGRYFVAVRDVDGETLYFSKHETAHERDQTATRVQKAYPAGTVKVGVTENSSELRQAMDPRIVAEIETLLGDAGAAPELQDAIWQRYLESMPELSARKRFIHRKGTAGYHEDAMRVFANALFHGAHQMGKIKYGLELQELTNKAKDQAEEADDQTRAMTLANELAKRHDWVMNPTGSEWAQWMTSVAFVYYLAASPAAAMVNLTQTVMLGVPILGAKYGGVAKSSAALLRASKDFVVSKGRLMGSSTTDDEKRAMEAFYESGLIDRTQSYDLAGAGQNGINQTSIRAKTMKVISWAFQQAEVVNRSVTALAAYRMARAAGRTEPDAIDAAHELTLKTHFDYSNSSRPAIMQNDFAKVALVFRQYQINYLYRVFRDIHQSLKGESAAVRKEARYQLAGVVGMMSLLAGVTGTIGFNLVMALASAIFGDDDDPMDFEQQFRKSVQDILGPELGGIVLNGAPGHYLGIDLTSRIGMPDLWFRSPSRDLQGKSEYEYWALQSLGASVSMIGQFWQGFSVIKDEGNVARGLEVAAPKFIRDLLKTYRYAQEGVTSARGDEILPANQIDYHDLVAQFLGFTPAKVAETWDRNISLKNAEQAILDKRRMLMNRFAMAVTMKDDEARKEAIADIKKFNAVPVNGPLAITAETLKRSLKTRARNAAKREDGVLIGNPALGKSLREKLPDPIYR